MNYFKLTESITINILTNEIVLGKDKKNKVIKIENQLVQILMLLVENKGEMVSKEIFIDKIWEGNAFVGENALTKNIFKLREVIRNYDLKNIKIETIPKKGYRLLVSNKESGLPKPSVFKKVFLGFFILISVMVVFSYMLRDKSNKKNEVNTIKNQDSIIMLDGSEGVKIIDTDTLKGKIIRLEDLE